MAGLIGVDPALLGTSAAAETAGASTMAGAMSGAGPEICSVLPPGADGASVAAAAGFNARGAATEAMMAELVAMRELFATTVGVNGVSYAAVDAVGQSMLTI
jgi:hypothetical protein